MMNNSERELRGRRCRPRRARTNSKPGAVSAAAATGRTLVLLATSCAALRSGRPTIAYPRGAVANGFVHFRERTTTPCGRGLGRPVSSLGYRNGDEDADRPLFDVRFAGAGAAARQMATDAVGRTSTTARLWTFLARLLSSPSASADLDEGQVAMKEYLSYVERRHSRLHQDAISRPMAMPFSSMINGSWTNESCRRPIFRFGSTLTVFQKVATAFLSSLRTMTKMILLDNSGLSVASLAILLMLRPYLEGAFQQG